jgi:NADH-quinone oxidoreductase subunit G
MMPSFPCQIAIPEGILSDGAIFLEIAKRFKLDIPEKPIPIEFIHRTPVQSPSQKFQQKEGLKATFARALFDRGERMRRNTQLIGMSKDPKIRMHPEEASKRHLEDDALISVSNSHGSVKGKLKIDRRVAHGTVVLPLGFSEIPVENLEMHYFNGFPVDVISAPLSRSQNMGNSSVISHPKSAVDSPLIGPSVPAGKYSSSKENMGIPMR